MVKRLRSWIDGFPTHKWMARIWVPVAILQRTTQFVSNDAFDTVLLVYLLWLSEVTAHESWLARRLEEDED